jgi:hypothetical protein
MQASAGAVESLGMARRLDVSALRLPDRQLGARKEGCPSRPRRRVSGEWSFEEKRTMNKYVLRDRATGQFVDRWGGLHREPAQAYVFPSTEEADSYRLRMLSAPASYEVCALSPDDQLAGAPSSSRKSVARPSGRRRKGPASGPGRQQ